MLEKVVYVMFALVISTLGFGVAYGLFQSEQRTQELHRIHIQQLHIQQLKNELSESRCDAVTESGKGGK